MVKNLQNTLKTLTLVCGPGWVRTKIIHTSHGVDLHNNRNGIIFGRKILPTPIFQTNTLGQMSPTGQECKQHVCVRACVCSCTHVCGIFNLSEKLHFRRRHLMRGRSLQYGIYVWIYASYYSWNTVVWPLWDMIPFRNFSSGRNWAISPLCICLGNQCYKTINKVNEFLLSRNAANGDVLYTKRKSVSVSHV